MSESFRYSVAIGTDGSITLVLDNLPITRFSSLLGYLNSLADVYWSEPPGGDTVD